jgi:hypothetical protein
MHTCPYCGREQLEPAERCPQCGKELAEDLAKLDPRRAAGEKQMARGALWLILGVTVTVFTYTVARGHGGSYIIAYGAIIGGLAMFFKGRFAAAGKIDMNEEATQLLEMAAMLESVDRVKATELYRKIIEQFPNTAQSEEASRNIQILSAHQTTKEIAQ